MKRTLYPTHALLNKAVLIFSLLFFFQMNSFAQGPKWTTLGNATSTGDFIGTTNFQPLVFKTGNTTRGAFTATGNFQLTNLIGTGNRLLQTDANGNLIPFTMATSSDVLYGDGTWGSLPLFPDETWLQSGSNIYYNIGNVGIGTSTPLFPLDVIGNVRISNNLYVGGGIVISDKVNANSEVVTGKMKADSIVTDSTKGFYGTSKFNGDVKLQNKLSVDGTTQINGDLYASVLKLGTPSDNFEIKTLTLPGGGKLLGIGTTPKPIPSCTPAYAPGNVQFNRVTINNSINLNAFDFRNEGMTAFIDFGENAISTTNPPTTLKINSFCSSNIDMCAAGGNVIMCTTPNGKVSIGTNYVPTDYKLAVQGKIIAEEVNVRLFGDWPDYVFDEDYKSLSIPELRDFTKKEKHLPNMPSAENVEKNGINLSEMVAKLLKSQEEQTKYIIQLYEQNLHLKKEIDLLKK